ncbi:putative transporter SVOPL isoform X12 [Heterocephalus glaber]|uniref:Transporter SVOPL isoform X12 n=1 Tax=Heterocephalus glaber TaxID=10181 RepID=A0AAX6TBS2_HETGA|nr:putative transporter SVOPL isoform X12 [Heterocephalus glaber]
MASKPTEPVTVLSLRRLSPAGLEPQQQKEPKTFTVEDAVETIGFGRFHIALFLIMGSTGVVEAMEIMLIAVVSPAIRCEWHLENWQVALVTTMVFFGYMVSSVLFGLLADRYGRWKILLLSFLWGAYFSLLTSFSPTYIWFVFLRTMVGCGVSGHAQGLIIKTEFLPTKYRGYMLPLSQEKRGRFADLLDAKYLRTTLQIWVIWLGISFAYYGVILASAELLERDLVCGAKSESQAAVPSEDSEGSQSPCYCHLFAPSDYRTMIISTIGEIALNPLNILGINFLGRRLSLSVTMGCTALFFLLLNICTSSAGLIGFLFTLRALVAANFNTIYIYTAEVYPTTMRALGMGTSGSLCRIGAMVAPFISQVLMSASILGALCLFSSVCVVGAISAFTLPIETKGRALQQIK